MELAPCLCYTAGIGYPTHNIADGAIVTSYTRPTWTTYFWCKHLKSVMSQLIQVFVKNAREHGKGVGLVCPLGVGHSKWQQPSASLSDVCFLWFRVA